MCTGFFNGLFDSFDFMATQIIHNDDVAFMKSRRKMLLNVVFKSLSI